MNSFMNRGVLALFLRTLREDTRSISTYLVRGLYCAFTIGAIYMVKEQARFYDAPGLTLFISFCVINIAIITLGGFSIFANTITQEKEEGTLGLLRMTRLNPLAILLGKSASRLTQAAILLLTQVPFSFLAVALGGLSVDQILSCYLSIVAYLFFVANMALLFSVICARTRSAAGLSFLALALFHLPPLLIEGLLSGPTRPDSPFWRELCEAISETFLAMNPVQRIFDVLSVGGDHSLFSAQVLANFGLGLAAFGAAWLGFEVFNRDAKPAGPKRSILVRKARGGQRRRAWRAALAWKDFTFITGGINMLRIKLLVYAGIAAFIGYICYAKVRTPRPGEMLGEILLGLFLVIAFIEATLYAARLFQQERQWSTLSSLALLPRSLRSIAYGKIGGAALALIPSMALVLLSGALHPKHFVDVLDTAFTTQEGLCVVFMALFFLHLVAYLSLRLKWSAIPAALLIMLALYLGTALCVFIWQQLNRFNHVGDDEIFPILDAFFLIGAFVLHYRTGRRFEAVVAES